MAVTNGRDLQYLDMDDRELLAATSRGDADAFAVFYRRHLPAIVSYCLRATGSAELAADLAAEVFAGALESCDRYEPVYDSAAAWLHGIARNKLLESRRRGRVEDATRIRLGVQPVVLEDRDLERVVALASQDALTLLDDLPAQQADAVRARVLDDRDYADLAAELNCSESVVRQRVSRGLARLRALLEPRGGIA
jgi:RNA polymerase sigma factor (sigma-70 family)